MSNISYSTSIDLVIDNLQVNSLTASSHVSSSYFYGDGSNLTNLPLQHLSATFISQSQLDNILLDYPTLEAVSGTFVSQSQIENFITGVVSSGNLSGSGTINDPLVLLNNISLNSVTASLYGTASYASNSDKLDGFHANQFAITGSNTFYGDQTISGTLYVSGNLQYATSSLYTNYIDFNTTAYTNPPPPPAQLGRVFYNGATGDITTYLDTSGLYLSNGQQLIQKCQNKSGSPLTKGTIVHLSGSDNSTDTPRINVADWSNDNMSANTLGVLMQDIADNATGYVIVQGVLTGLSLGGLTSPANGQVLYLSSSGQVTNIKPTSPKHSVSVGQLIGKADTANAKIMYVSIQNGYELEELHDVSASVSKINGDLLTWDSGSSVWKNGKQLSGSYEISGSLNVTNAISASQITGTLSGTFNGTLINNPINSLVSYKARITGSVNTSGSMFTVPADKSFFVPQSAVFLLESGSFGSGLVSVGYAWGSNELFYESFVPSMSPRQFIDIPLRPVANSSAATSSQTVYYQVQGGAFSSYTASLNIIGYYV